MGLVVSLTLHLGVIDTNYTHSRGKETTGDVAEWLENKYGIMEFFVGAHGDMIQTAVEDAIKGNLETLMLGGDGVSGMADVLLPACGEIETAFRHFLDAKEMDGKVPGVATAASLEGVSNRFKGRKAMKGRGKQRVRVKRPSFIDTGLYQQSFRTWAD